MIKPFMVQKHALMGMVVVVFISLIAMLPSADVEKLFYKKTSSQKISLNQTVLSPVTVQSKAPVLKASEFPEGYHPLPASATHTAYMGTVDHPTIDGGMINVTDGIPITQDNPELTDKKEEPIKKEMPNEKALPEIVTTNAKDDWATSARVKRLLVSAAEEGKLDYVLKKSEAMGLPASVAVVPMVESNYQNTAVSGKGAAGAWQLMPSVAKDYGISNEERQQFTKSTDTALQLLTNLHQQFGNWEYAFAAYNAGATRVQNAILKNPQATSVEQLALPLETKQYVKRIMGLNKTMMTLPEVH